MERFIGRIKKIEGEEVTFRLDRRVDINSLSRLSDGVLPTAEIAFRDQRMITPEQRKKAWAMIYDVSRHTGYDPIDAEMWTKSYFMAESGRDYFSLGDCNVETAREYISFLIEFCFMWNIPFKDKGIHMADDVSKYLWLCIKHRKCVVCGLKADIHHVDTVGMGNDRRKVNHGEKRLMAVCRKHHQEAERIGQARFDRLHQVTGIKLRDRDLVEFKITTQKNVDSHKKGD